MIFISCLPLIPSYYIYLSLFFFLRLDWILPFEYAISFVATTANHHCRLEETKFVENCKESTKEKRETVLNCNLRRKRGVFRCKPIEFHRFSIGKNIFILLNFPLGFPAFLHLFFLDWDLIIPTLSSSLQQTPRKKINQFQDVLSSLGKET